MVWLSDLSIKSKIYVIVMSICFITLTFIAVAMTLSSHKAAERALKQRMSIIAEAVSQNISAAVIFKDSEAAQDILSAYSVDKHIVLAEVFDRQGELIARYQRESLGNK